MDDGTVAAIPEDERLSQDNCVQLFGPVAGESVWVNRDGTTLCSRGEMRKRDMDAWHAAMDRGEADTADLEWRLHDFGVSLSDVRAQLEVAARVLDDLGIGVEWEADRLGFVFRFGNGRGGVIDEPLGLRNVGFGPIRLFDERNGQAPPPERVRLEAAAFLGGMDLTAALRRMDAGVFTARHRVDIPATALDGMTPWQRGWAAGGLRLGAFGGRIVALARDGCAEPHYIYDGPDMDGAVGAILEHAALMEDRQATSEVAAMSMQGGGRRHGVGGMPA